MEGRCRVLVMGPDERYRTLLGLGEVLWIPVVAIKPVKGCSLAVLNELPHFSLVVFTSPRTIDVLLEDARLNAVGERLLSELSRRRIAVIGPKTAESLERYGISYHIMPQAYNSKELARAIVELEKPNSVLIVRSKEGSRALTSILEEAGVPYKEVHAYEIVVNGEAAIKASSAIESGVVDYAVFTSSAIARAVCTRLERAPEKTVLVALGEPTLKTLLAHCKARRVLVPKNPTLNSVFELLRGECGV